MRPRSPGFRVAVLIAVLLFALSAGAVVKTMYKAAFASAVLPAASAWSNGATVNPGFAETAKLYCTYTTHASSTTGYPDLSVQYSNDSGTTWWDYSVCADDAAKAAVTGVDEYQAECMTRVWYIDTPGVAATAAQFPILEFDMAGVAAGPAGVGRIRVRGREIGDTTNRGTLACTWGLGEVRR